jgi:hypothetical protein
MSKFQALKTLLQDAIPAVAKEGEEAVASTIAKETEEKLAEDAAREAFKAEFDLPVAHGSSLEKIMTQKQAESGIIDPDWVPYRIKQFNDGTYPYIDPKTGAFHQLEPHEFPMISTLKPSTGWGAGYGEGVYTASQTPRGAEIGNYQDGFGEMSIPLRLRGKKVFNFADTFDERNPELKGLIPSRQESVSKLSKLSGVPEEEIHKLIRENWISKVNELVEKHPEEFESMYFDKLFKTFDPKNIRSPFAKFDPAKKDSTDFMAGLGAATLAGTAMSSDAEASPFKNIKGLVKGIAPTVAKEGEEAALSAATKEAEEAAYKESFKSAFEPGWYHGTPSQNPIKKFRSGSFFTKDPEFANVYTKKLEPVYAGMAKDETQGQIIPVNLRTNSFFDSENPEHLEQFKNRLKESFEEDRPNISEFPGVEHPEDKLYKLVTDELMGKDTYDSEKLAQAVIDHVKAQNGNWMGLEDNQLENLIKNRGNYSGMFVKEDAIDPVTGMYTNKVLKNALSFYPYDVRLPWAKFDPKDALSGDTLAGIGAATLGAGALSSEAKAEPTKSPSDFTNIKKQLIKDYSPSFGSKEGDFSSYDESEALPTEGMQGRGLATIIRNMVGDKKPPGEFKEGGGGITEPAVSPIDFITPGMVTSPLQYKKLLKVIGK